jgi:hypothetical protein
MATNELQVSCTSSSILTSSLNNHLKIYKRGSFRNSITQIKIKRTQLLVNRNVFSFTALKIV